VVGDGLRRDEDAPGRQLDPLCREARMQAAAVARVGPRAHGIAQQSVGEFQQIGFFRALALDEPLHFRPFEPPFDGVDLRVEDPREQAQFDGAIADRACLDEAAQCRVELRELCTDELYDPFADRVGFARSEMLRSSAAEGQRDERNSCGDPQCGGIATEFRRSGFAEDPGDRQGPERLHLEGSVACGEGEFLLGCVAGRSGGGDDQQGEVLGAVAEEAQEVDGRRVEILRSVEDNELGPLTRGFGEDIDDLVQHLIDGSFAGPAEWCVGRRAGGESSLRVCRRVGGNAGGRAGGVWSARATAVGIACPSRRCPRRQPCRDHALVH
jgi:hypothetical protein